EGAVAVGLPPSLGVLIGVPLAETIRSEFPQIRLRLSEGLSGHILDWLAEGSLDLGFMYEVPGGDAFEAMPVFREELSLVSASDFVPDSARGEPPSIPLEALQALPFVLPSAKHNARRIVDRIFRATGIAPEIVSEIDSHSQIV